MTLSTIDVPTNSRVEIQDITGRVRAAVEESGVRQGICMVYTPHTTAAITVNENADPSVKSDMVMEMIFRQVPAIFFITYNNGVGIAMHFF